MSKFKSWAIISLLLILGFALRWYHNTDISLWHDEAFSALLLKYPWGEMFYRIGLDVHPPAYYVALRFWHYVFGDELWSLRLFSVFFGLASAVVAYFLAFKITKQKIAGLFALGLVIFNPFQIQYATEARMYTFGAFLALLSGYLLVLALDENANNKKSFWLYSAFGFTSGVAALTHYYLLFSVVALYAYALLYLAFTYKFQFKKYLYYFWSGILSVLMFLPWLKWFLYQFRQVGEGYWIPPMNKWSIPTTLWQILSGHGVDISQQSSQIIVLLITAFVVYLVVGLMVSRQKHKLLPIFGFLAPFAGSALFLVLALLDGSKSSVFLVRYFLYASVFLCVMLGVWLSNMQSKFVAWGIFVIVLAFNVYSFQKFQKDLWVEPRPGMAGLAERLISDYSEGDKILSASSFEFFNLKYYLAEKNDFGFATTATSVDPVVTSSGFRCEIDCLNFKKVTRPMLYSGGKSSVSQMSHFEGTAILTNSDLYPDLSNVPSGTQVWMVWTNAFGGSQPSVPNNWTEIDEAGFAEVRPYVGTWIIATKYFVNP